MVVMGFGGLTAGRITDRIGPRPVVVVCGIALAASYMLTSTIHSVWQFYVFYGIAGGIGMSVTTPLMSLVARWFVKKRALMSSILTAGPAFGNMAMPLVFSVVIHGVGWRWSYMIMAGIALVFIIASAVFVRRDPGEVGLQPYGADEDGVKEATLQSEGMSVLSALRTNQYWLVSFLFFCDFFLFKVVTVHIVIHAVDLGIPATEAAGILSVASGVCAVARIIIGGFADRYGCKPTFMVCLVLAVVSFALLLVADTLWMLYLFAAIFGFGLWASGGLIPPLTADLFGLKAHGTIYGSIFLSGATGGAFGPVVVGYLFDVTGNYQLAFVVCFCITILALLALIVLKPVRKFGRL
jgi:MFS family permease